MGNVLDNLRHVHLHGTGHQRRVADLTDIYHTSFFTSTYGELPTLVANPQPDMTLIYNAFRCLPPNPHDIAPYFNGYLGSHVSV
ncbi:hypothetical protein BDR07DRAFT_1490748 [Suillus spraguei]|nr:hypothetical protein BDR07DRAFT_1490748 [Suillus spraguei]